MPGQHTAASPTPTGGVISRQEKKLLWKAVCVCVLKKRSLHFHCGWFQEGRCTASKLQTLPEREGAFLRASEVLARGTGTVVMEMTIWVIGRWDSKDKNVI